MKLQSIFATCLLALGVSLAASAQEIKLNLPAKPDASAPAPAATPAATALAAPAAAPAFTTEQLVEEWGWFMSRRLGISELNFTKEQIDALAKGVASGAAGSDTPYDLPKIGPVMDEFIQKKQAAYVEKLKKQGLAETAAFMTEIKKKPGVQVLADGLAYEIVTPGAGAAPKPTDTVKVHYTGSLINGSVFDSSVQRGEPTEIPLDQVIPGWTEGLQKISKGGKIKLYIPPHLAYGDDGKGGIPPGSTLIFEIELLDIKPTPAQPAAAPAGK